MREYTIKRYLRYYLIRVKDFFINWVRDWWKPAGDGAECFACCDVCLRMCPECNKCHSADIDQNFNHTGLYCPHKGYTYPENLPETMKHKFNYAEEQLKSILGLKEEP